MGADGDSAKAACRWCASDCPGLICPVCKGPNRWWLIGVVATYKLFAIGALSAAITVVGYWVLSQQNRTTKALATHEKLLSSYVDFAATHSSYRHASSSITFLASSSASVVPAGELKTAALDLDNAFDAVGAKLTPFEDVERSLKPGQFSVLQDIWQACFIHAYFDKKLGYWPRVESQLSRCDNDTCPVDVARSIKTMIVDIDQPHCDPLRPETQKFLHGSVNISTVWDELGKIITDQCAAGKLACKSVFSTVAGE